MQIRTEEMDLIAERGIAAHYSGREFVTGLVGSATPSSKSSRGKTVCLNNANIALRVYYLPLRLQYDRNNLLDFKERFWCSHYPILMPLGCWPNGKPWLYNCNQNKFLMLIS